MTCAILARTRTNVRLLLLVGKRLRVITHKRIVNIIRGFGNQNNSPFIFRIVGDCLIVSKNFRLRVNKCACTHK